MQEHVVRLQVALVLEFPEAYLTHELGLHPALIFDVPDQMSFLLVRRIAVGAHVPSIYVGCEMHIPES